MGDGQWLHGRDQKIGGPGKTVEIDEAKFAKQKHHVGRIPVMHNLDPNSKWLVGAIVRGGLGLTRAGVGVQVRVRAGLGGLRGLHRAASILVASV